MDEEASMMAEQEPEMMAIADSMGEGGDMMKDGEMEMAMDEEIPDYLREY